MTDADRMTRAVQALHAVRKNVDAYLQFAAEVEQAGNAIRDVYEQMRRESLAP